MGPVEQLQQDNGESNPSGHVQQVGPVENYSRTIERVTPVAT